MCAGVKATQIQHGLFKHNDQEGTMPRADWCQYRSFIKSFESVAAKQNKKNWDMVLDSKS